MQHKRDLVNPKQTKNKRNDLVYPKHIVIPIVGGAGRQGSVEAGGPL